MRNPARGEQGKLQFSAIGPAECRRIEIQIKLKQVAGGSGPAEWSGQLRWRADQAGAALLDRLCEALLNLCVSTRDPDNQQAARQ